MYEIFYIVYNVKATRDILKISQDPNMQKHAEVHINKERDLQCMEQ